MSNTSPASSFAASPEQHATSPSTNHDSSILSQSLPELSNGTPNISGTGPDSEKHPKGKRKRTAAKDKVVLEEAYKNNPKPDKQVRVDIVDRVSLNEKEVQIWFQNRRQNDRRKSRPLSTQELAALRYGGMHGLSSDPVTSRSFFSESDKSFPASDPAASQAVEFRPASPAPRTSSELSQSFSDTVNATPKFASQESNGQDQPASTPNMSQELASSQESQVLSQSFPGSVGYLANRWNLGSSFSTPSTLGRGGDDSLRLEPFAPQSVSPETSTSASQSQSKVRLSLSLEGKAELVSNQLSPTRAQPSPVPTLPALPIVRQRSLQRSHSALPSITLPPISALTSSLPPRLVRGRSRDVHAWELCADADTRDELTTHAEHESNGSAIAAISLLRSTSGVLQPSASKRNAPVTKSQQSRLAKKPKLGRTSSSVARLENVEVDAEKPGSNLNGKVKVSMLVSPTDSDKENWSPDEDGGSQNGPRRRALPTGPGPHKSQNPRRLGRILQENKGPSLLNGRANTTPSRARAEGKGAVEIFEDGEAGSKPSRSDEVEKFMRGEVSPSKKPDMDCVAGLLSLSQGAWR